MSHTSKLHNKEGKVHNVSLHVGKHYEGSCSYTVNCQFSKSLRVTPLTTRRFPSIAENYRYNNQFGTIINKSECMRSVYCKKQIVRREGTYFFLYNHQLHDYWTLFVITKYNRRLRPRRRL